VHVDEARAFEQCSGVGAVEQRSARTDRPQVAERARDRVVRAGVTPQNDLRAGSHRGDGVRHRVFEDRPGQEDHWHPHEVEAVVVLEGVDGLHPQGDARTEASRGHVVACQFE